MSGRTYQTLQRYKGGLSGGQQYTGIEYDYEVPDNVVVSSPGGLSGIHHHSSKGFYSDASSSYDVYAGEGNAYPYGELGNLYQEGQTASREMSMYPPNTDQMYTGNQSTAHVENFRGMGTGQTQIPGMELISPADTNSAVSVASTFSADQCNKKLSVIHLPNPLVVLLMLLLMYFAVNFITMAGQTVLFSRFHAGKVPDWRWLCFYAAVFMGIAIAIGATMKNPLLALRQFEGELNA